MEQFDFSNYKINQLAYLIHKSLGNTQIIEQIIQHFSLDNLVNSKNNGIISNLLQYYIGLSDNMMIEQIVTKVELLEKFQLMKRDYLNLIKYYYNNEEKSEWLCTKLLAKINYNTESMFQSKDIDFIIENNMGYILKKLVGLFIETTISSYPVFDPNYLPVKKYHSSESIINSIITSIENDLPIELKLNLEKYYHNLTHTYNAIIDGGNVLHSRKGIIYPNSLQDLIIVIDMVSTTIGNPLLIIHKRHFKTIPNLQEMLKSKKISYYMTPYNINDDMFILWFFLKTNTQSYIISNDKYRDHIFKFETDKKKANSNFSWSQFKHIIGQQTLGYDIVNNTINNPTTFSRCIQRSNDKIYIPHTNNGFVEFTINPYNP